MKQVLVILRGAPASGKTTISKELRDFDKKVAWLKVDNFKDFFTEDSSAALEYVNGSALATLDYLFKQDFSVVMDGVFQDTSAVDEAVRLAKEKNIKTIIYQIKCSLATLQERDRNRPGIKEGCREPLGDEEIESLCHKVEDNPLENGVKLDTENQTLEACLAIIRKNFE